MPDTPFFPAWRGRFGHFGRHFRQLRQHSLLQLDRLLAPLLPAGWLAQADEGPNSRERVYIGAFRCDGCGYLEFYADPKFAAQ